MDPSSRSHCSHCIPIVECMVYSHLFCARKPILLGRIILPKFPIVLDFCWIYLGIIFLKIIIQFLCRRIRYTVVLFQIKPTTKHFIFPQPKKIAKISLGECGWRILTSIFILFHRSFHRFLRGTYVIIQSDDNKR